MVIHLFAFDFAGYSSSEDDLSVCRKHIFAGILSNAIGLSPVKADLNFNGFHIVRLTL